MPPVSMSVNSRPSHSASAVIGWRLPSIVSPPHQHSPGRIVSLVVSACAMQHVPATPAAATILNTRVIYGLLSYVRPP